jgi:uncharacterized protein (DUF4415 family)
MLILTPVRYTCKVTAIPHKGSDEQGKKMVRNEKQTEAEGDLISQYERIMAAADLPLLEMEFDDAELNADLDDLPLLPAVAPVKSVDATGTTSPLTGTHPISIRLPVQVIAAFKAQANKTGGNYQTMMNRALREAASGFV